jgi:hypothetical protein
MQDFTPDETEEFEFRARAEAEQANRRQIEQAQPAAAPGLGDQIVNNVVAPVFGAGAAAAHAIGANPLTAAGAAIGAAKYGAVKNLATEGLNNWRNQNLTNMAESIRKGERFGQNVDAMKDAFKIQQEQHAARLAAQQAAAARPGIAQQIQQVAAQRVQGLAPAADSIMQRVAPYINNPLTRGIAKIGGVGGQMATYSGGLNTNEEQELARRRGMGPTLR